MGKEMPWKEMRTQARQTRKTRQTQQTNVLQWLLRKNL